MRAAVSRVSRRLGPVCAGRQTGTEQRTGKRQRGGSAFSDEFQICNSSSLLPRVVVIYKAFTKTAVSRMTPLLSEALFFRPRDATEARFRETLR